MEKQLQTKRDSLESFQRICRENTGSNFLDSGSAYGYGYNRPNCDGIYRIETIGDGKEINYISISTAHFLHAILATDAFSEKLDAAFLKFAEVNDESYFQNRRDFIARLNHIEYYQSANTYNFDNNLDQVLEYTIFQYDGNGEYYIALQVHTGCDVRGGYTRPYFFRIRDIDYFDPILSASEVTPSGKWIKDYEVSLPDGCKLNRKGEIKHGRNTIHLYSTAALIRCKPRGGINETTSNYP